MPRPLVNFFIAGVQKGGTTALDTYLRSHPDVSMASRKETHFFDSEQHDWSAPDYSVLHDFFPTNNEEKLLGEATPIYTYWPRSIERIKEYNPAAKLIVCLRHPAFRAHSHWRMEVSRGNDPLSFQDAVREAGRSRVRCAPDGVHRVYSYVERGYYAWQIKRLFGQFSREQIMFVKTDQLWSEASRVVAGIHRFLGVARGPSVPDRQYYISVDTRDLGRLSDDDRAYLTDLFRGDIIESSTLTGLDLTDWLEPTYAEPMHA